MDKYKTNRLERSTSAFLQARIAKRLPTPLIDVKANATFCPPSIFVFKTRRIWVNCDSSETAIEAYKNNR